MSGITHSLATLLHHLGFSSQPEGRLNAESSAAFLRDVLAQTRRHVMVMQDGARYHTSQAMQDFFKAHATRLTIEQLPSYSPDCNPIEHLWKKAKKEATHTKHFRKVYRLTGHVWSLRDEVCERHCIHNRRGCIRPIYDDTNPAVRTLVKCRK
jgi:transposase